MLSQLELAAVQVLTRLRVDAPTRVHLGLRVRKLFLVPTRLGRTVKRAYVGTVVRRVKRNLWLVAFADGEEHAYRTNELLACADV
jgi:hypothetical protein